MSRRAIGTATSCVLLAAVALTGCPTTPNLAVSPLILNFGLTVAKDTVTIRNQGGGALTWALGPLPAWLSASQLAGSATSATPSLVTLTIDRLQLAKADTVRADIPITSNGGSKTLVVLAERGGAQEPVPTLALDQQTLNFGETATTLDVRVSNTGAGSLTWQMAESIPWLELSATSGTAVAGTPNTVRVTVTRAGLTPGNFLGSIAVTSNGGNATINAEMTVPGPAPILSVTPLSLDFGLTTARSQIVIANTGTGQLNWTLTEDIPWLSVDIDAGSITSSTQTVNVNVNRAGLAQGAFTGAMTINAAGGGAATVNVRMDVGPPELLVSPLTLNFGSFVTNRLFTVRNPGSGTVNYTINTAGLPPWLTVSPTSGDVTTESDGILVTVSRAGLDPGPFTASIPVTTNPDVGSATVQVNMTVDVVPVLLVNTGAVNPDARPLAAVGEAATRFPFTITNDGTGTLNWEIKADDLASWLTIEPLAGSLLEGQSQTVTIIVSRRELSPGGFSHNVPIRSNGGNVIMEVTMVVPLRPIIGTDTDRLNFGIDEIASAFFVANVGDPGTLLNFFVTADKPQWLFHSPATGVSIGVPGPIKDFKQISVAIDRGNLDGVSSTGKFTIVARDPSGAIIEDIKPREVLVSVEASPLTFEGAVARLRIPSLVRFVFTMRDFRNDAIPVSASDLPPRAFLISENGVDLELTETNQFLTGGPVIGATGLGTTGLRTAVVVALDYSGSVFDAAVASGLPGADPLQDLYERAVGDIITNMPGTWELALLEFHDRNQPTRLRQNFTTDKTALLNALNNIQVDDHGASELLPALEESILLLANKDFPLVAYDDSEIRIVLVITDGRLTTPPGRITDTIDLAINTHTQIFAIGWGENVNNEPLARLAGRTGGHYYSTQPDNGGFPVEAELAQRATQFTGDVLSSLVLSYITLNHEDSITTRVNAAFDNPLDPDPTVIQGTFAQRLDFSPIVGDIRLGQISMRTTGIANNSATVFLRADYIPRNITQFRFTLSSPEVFTVEKVPAANGGLVEDWTLDDLGGGVFTLTAPAGVPLQYGAFGELLSITFATPGSNDFRLALDVDNTIYTSPDDKFFVFPDTIPVRTERALAPAFPTPVVEPLLLDFGTGADSLPIGIQNGGGAFVNNALVNAGLPDGPITYLTWEVVQTPSFVTVKPNNPPTGFVVSTLDQDTLTVEIDRSALAGDYSGEIRLLFTTGDPGFVNILTEMAVAVRGRVLPPQIQLSANTLDFGDTLNSLTLDVTNIGQSTMSWSIATTALPSWLTVSPSSGTTIRGEVDQVTVEIDRAQLAAPFQHTLSLSWDGGAQTLGTENILVLVTP